ncbi:MAG: serine hydrolase domain-containing protein [Pyrinomonadaceae bacterium]
MLRLVLAFLLLNFAFVPVRADGVDDYVHEQLQARHIPGLSLVVVREGKIVKAQSYGLANIELNAPVSIESVFEIGSITKQLTAAAIMLLVEEGKVKLDERINVYLSDLHPPEAWDKVTVRHLLTHTSGIKTYTGLPGFEFSKHLKGEEFVKALSGFPLDFQPGEKWSYSNSGFNLLGLIIEKASHQPYWEFMAARIYKPLGMTATRDRDPVPIVKGRVTGYEWKNGAWINRDTDLTDIFSAGATVSTALDLAKWNAALDAERLLKKTSLEQIWTPVRLTDGKTHPYGFGWDVDTVNGHRLISHGGQTAGFSASIARYVDDKLTIIVLCNLGESGVAGKVRQGIAKLYVPALP